MQKIFFFLLLNVFLVGCTNSDTRIEIAEDDVALAKVKDEVLLLSQIPAFQLRNLSKEDSIAYLKNYVNNWLKEEAYTQKAKENLQDFSAINSKTRQFKNDLIRSSYEKKVTESLEIELADADIVNYYNSHQDYFIFKEDYFEILYILLPKNTSEIQQIKKNISEDKPSAFVESYCISNAEKCHLKDSVVKSESYLVNTLKLQKSLLFVSSRFKYFYPSDSTILIYKIVSKKNKGDVAPLNIIRSEVTSLVLENKKQEFLQDLEEKTYQKAKNDKIFESYIN